MSNVYYRTETLEQIARRILTAYDPDLYYGRPRAVPIEAMIEWHGLSLEYQYLRKNGSILGKTIFDDGLEAVYDMERQKYVLFPVRAGTILIDAALCEEEPNGRLRFTCAHELAHWVLHKSLYTGSGDTAALDTGAEDSDLEVQANLLGSALLMPMPQVKRCFYQTQRGKGQNRLVADMSEVFQVSHKAMRIRLESHKLIQ